MGRPEYTHTTSTVVDAPIATVWTEIRDIVQFAGIVLGGAVENLTWVTGATVDRVPAKFSFNLKGDNKVLVEELVGRSEIDHTIQYEANVQVLQMIKYWAEVRLQPVTLPADQTFITYTRKFVLEPNSTHQQLHDILGIMDGEMAALKTHFAAQPVANR